MARYMTDRCGRTYVDRGMGFIPLNVPLGVMVNPTAWYAPLLSTPAQVSPIPGMTELTEVPVDALEMQKGRTTPSDPQCAGKKGGGWRFSSTTNVQKYEDPFTDEISEVLVTKTECCKAGYCDPVRTTSVTKK